MNTRCSVLKMDVDVINLTNTVARIKDLAASRRGAYVCLSNVHMCMETFDCEAFRSVVCGADLVIPDGRPVYWAQRLLGENAANHVRGQDIMNALCQESETKGLRIGLFGGSSELVLEQVKHKLSENHPGINIVYAYSPPFRQLTDSEDQQVINDINAADVDILFVGIGCPKQERWMASHRSNLQCAMLGVGAAFDFISGNKKHAPRWMQTAGLEWLFRLTSEPGRLWKRYLKNNPRFVYYFARQWLGSKMYVPGDVQPVERERSL